jgi:hypothetical protein
MTDRVNHPLHYTQGKVECIDALQSLTTGLEGYEGYLVASSVKYLWRWKSKNGLEDLKKAKWFLERLVAHVEDEAWKKRITDGTS